MWMSRKKYSAKFKLQVVLELLSWKKTQSEITSEFSVHPSQQNSRKQQLIDNAKELFKDKRAKENKENEKLIEELYKQIGQVSYERDWLKKKTWFELPR